jgi:hypothetical protein
MLRVGFVTGSDREHDVGGACNTVGVTLFGEPCAQLRKVGHVFYIKQPDGRQSATTMATVLLTINQPASKPAPVYQRTCSLTPATVRWSGMYRKKGCIKVR